jgi:FTR1 family protein
VLPTFVIGLREGLEASLIVGIIAAFLTQQGRRDALRRMWLGVGVAIVICIAAAVALQIVDENLPQRQQEMLETIVALAAVAMVTYMIIFMRNHPPCSSWPRSNRRRRALRRPAARCSASSSQSSSVTGSIAAG